MSSVVSINKITDASLDKYDNIDQVLIPSQSFLRNFNASTDYIECHIYTKDDILLNSNYNVTEYTIPNVDGSNTNQIVFDPGTYLTNRAYNVGDFKLDYRVYRRQIYTLALPTFFITEISTDRTEIRLSSNIVSNLTLETNTLNFINQMQSSLYYKDFLLNFGDNNAVSAVNIAIDKNTNPYSLLIKLYQPLPAQFALKSTLWIVEELASPIVFEVVLSPDFKPVPVPMLASADFDIEISPNRAIASPYVSQNTIYTTNTLQNYQNLLNQLNNDSIDINIDYTDYTNFVHFSSAAQRLVNFVYKITEIEQYGLNIATLNTIPSQSISVSGSAQSIQNNINSLIQNMDGYETYLYTVSSSYAWPKSGSVLYSVTSSQALAWLGDNATYGQLYTASLYDLENQDNSVYSIPSYLADDPNNSDYLLFTNMIGQHYDSIWVYIKAINDIHKADNNLNTGISKDMVYSVLRSYGIDLYNNNSNTDLVSYLIGSPSGSYNVTSSGVTISGQDRAKELYKRIYHNLPYLLKSKGTSRNLQNLATVYGIPDTILTPIQYGGSDKNSNTLEYSYDRFSYSMPNNTDPSTGVYLIWAPLAQNQLKYNSTDSVADTIELRIKPIPGQYQSHVSLLQCILYNNSSAVPFGVYIDYTSSQGIPSANFTLKMSGSAGYVSSSVCIPFYITGSDGDTSFWNISLSTKNKYVGYNAGLSGSQVYTLSIQNAISGRVGITGSASINNTGSINYGINNSWYGYGYGRGSGSTVSNNTLFIGSFAYSDANFVNNFSGSIQEVRLWSEPLSKLAFNSHTLNSDSIQGNTISGSYNDLAARFPLGNDLVNPLVLIQGTGSYLQSVHPNWQLPYSNVTFYSGSGGSLYGTTKYGTGRYGATQSQAIVYQVNTNYLYFYNYDSPIACNSEYELAYSNTPNAGYYAPVTEKVRIFDNTPVSGSIDVYSNNILSPWFKVETEDVNRTSDLQFTEMSFSPQNEINKDIIAQYGNLLDLDPYLGDTSNDKLSYYPGVVQLNNSYRQKYISKYNYIDYINLIEQVDNTLFKMLQDFVPARTTLSTGLTIKSPILERNKVPRYQPSMSGVQYTASLKTNKLSAGTSYSKFKDEMTFMTGKLSGSYVNIHDNFEQRNYNPYLLYTQSLNQTKFKYSGFNITYGDVYENRLSTLFKKDDVNNPNLLGPVALQDSEYNHSRYVIPRYKGSKISVSKLNTYTQGDVCYGKVPNINTYVGKFGYVLKGSSNNLNFLNKTTFSLKYLFNESGSATTLTKANKNLFEVQNTFKSGDILTVSLTDVLTPSNQFSLGGLSQIYLGGYAFQPIIYRENGDALTFTYLNPQSSYSSIIGFKAVMPYQVSWTTNGYDTNENFALNSPYGRNHDQISMFINGVIITPQQFSLYNGTLSQFNSMYPNVSTDYGDRWYINNLGGVMGPYNNGGVGSLNLEGFYELSYFYTSDLSSQGFISPSSLSGSISFDGVHTPSHLIFTAPRTSNYLISANIPISYTGNHPEEFCGIFKVVGVVERFTEGNWTYVTNTKLTNWNLPPQQSGDASGIDDGSFGYEGTVHIWNNLGGGFITLNQTLNNYNVYLNAGDELRLRVFFLDLSRFFQGSYMINLVIPEGGYFEVIDALNSTTNVVTTQSLYETSIFSVTESINSGYNDTLVFDVSSSLLYNNSIFSPQYITSGDSWVTASYSPIQNTFSIKPGDIVRLGSIENLNSPIYVAETVIPPVVSGSTVSKPLQVVLDRAPLSGSYTNSSSGSLSSNFAIIRLEPDETSVIINKIKQPGDVSSLVLIPEYLDPNVESNITNIIQPLTGNLLPQ